MALFNNISSGLNATMRGVVWEGTPFSMVVDTLPIPTLQSPTDAIIRIQASAICGTDLHVYHGVYGAQQAPWGMGHEAVGFVDQIGDGISSVNVGDYVIIPDAFGSGHFEMGPAPNEAIGLGTDFGMQSGTQAPYILVPHADDNLVPVPMPAENRTENMTNSLANSYVLASDIFATAWGALDYADFEPGDTVAVFGAGPVGLLAAYSAMLRGASTVYSIDHVQSRLDLAASIGAIPINFVDTDPVQEIMRREPNGVRRSLDCVGYEAVNANLELQQGIVIDQMIAVTGYGGGIGQIGIWNDGRDTPGTPRGSTLSPNMTFPMADFFIRGLSMRSGPVNVREILPQLVELIASGKANPSFIVSSEISIEDAPEYYSRFDQHLETKVIIHFP